jgi:hypothetical protein
MAPGQDDWRGSTAPSHPQVLLSPRDQALAEAVAVLLRPALEEINRKLDAILTRLPQTGHRLPAAPRRRPRARP